MVNKISLCFQKCLLKLLRASYRPSVLCCVGLRDCKVSPARLKSFACLRRYNDVIFFLLSPYRSTLRMYEGPFNYLKRREKRAFPQKSVNASKFSHPGGSYFIGLSAQCVSIIQQSLFIVTSAKPITY